MVKQRTIHAKLKFVKSFVDQIEPIAQQRSETGYHISSDQEDKLFGDCPDFCYECGEKIIYRVSDTLETACMKLLLDGNHSEARSLWLTHYEWMGARLPDWRTHCELWLVRNDCSESIEWCDNCGVLLDGYVDPSSLNAEQEWEHWEHCLESSSDWATDQDELACMYYLLHEICLIEDGKNNTVETVERAYRLVSAVLNKPEVKHLILGEAACVGG